MKKLKIIFLCVCVCFLKVYAQNTQENVLYHEIQQAKKSNIHFENAVFEETSADVTALGKFINSDEVFFFSCTSLDVKNDKSKAIRLQIPIKTKNMILEIMEVPESFYNYEVIASNGQKFPANKDVKHYRGVVKDIENSLVAITFYKDEIIGLISTDEGNFNIVKDYQSSKHIFYNEQNLKEKTDPICGTVNDLSFSYDPEVLSKQRSVLSEQASAIQTRINKEVRFYVETEYDIYQTRGSMLSVEANIAGLITVQTIS